MTINNLNVAAHNQYGSNDNVASFQPSKQVDPEFLNAIKEKYNVLDLFQLLNYDFCPEKLIERLTHVRKSKFEPNDRIIVVHFDTDYYIHNQFGIFLTNFFNIWRSLDIPFHNLLFYTNNFGIQQEINVNLKYQDPMDMPTVIETFLNPLNYNANTYNVEPEIDVDLIEYHGLSMMNVPRSHRYALYNHLKDLSNKLALVIKAHK